MTQELTQQGIEGLEPLGEALSAASTIVGELQEVVSNVKDLCDEIVKAQSAV